MSDQAELIPIAEAARRLGIHKNTVHAHVKAGWHRWEWMPGPKGKQIGIYAADLHNTGPIDASTSVQMDPSTPVDASPSVQSVQSVHMDPSGRMDASGIDADAIARAAGAALAPYLDRLATISEENGRLKEQVRQLEARIAELQEPAAPSLPADMSPPWWKRLFRKDHR